jgi:hypothetical protein
VKLGQGAFEYILVIGIAMLLIVPGVVLFYNYSLKSNDEVMRSQINMIGNDIMDAVEKVYYIGEYSWQSLKIDIPNKVTNIYILDNSELVVEYHSYSGVSEAVFFSDINITPGGNAIPSPPGAVSISNSMHPGLNIIKVVSMGSYVLINETR